MGNTLCKWAGRISSLYNLTPMAQCILLRMANAAVDPDVSDCKTPKTRRGIAYLSREELARQIYGDKGKMRNLNRPIAQLRSSGLIVPDGVPAHKGHVQEYRICVYEAVALRYDELYPLYRRDAAELGRIRRLVTSPGT